MLFIMLSYMLTNVGPDLGPSFLMKNSFYMLKKVEFPILILLFSFAIYCALVIGISWDELGHIYIGNERLKYLFSFGSYD